MSDPTTQTTKRIYVAGPMSGRPDFNRPAFHEAAANLRSRGYEVENPAENPPPSCGSWYGWMRLGIAQIIKCDTMILLPGWETSRGANIERQLAIDLGINVVDYEAI